MKKSINFISGVLVGAMLLPSALAASGVIAERSAQPIYVDGKQVQMSIRRLQPEN